jgi:hypothetical protein
VRFESDSFILEPMAFNFLSTLPSWMFFIEGETPTVLVAPHGGRRPADAPIKDNVKVNDLYTAELTALLAARTSSFALVNQSLDRNNLDLNRISQVRAHAPWFLEALVEIISALVESHGTARVFFIHGWNVVQPVCDLGVGLRQRGTHIVPAGKASPTLSTDFFAAEIFPFFEASLAQGIDMAVGRRYPAADKNNVMQLFSARFAEDPSPLIRTLAELSAQGTVNAAQLELGVGLRWPGPERERFVEIFCQTLGNSKTTPLTSIDPVQGNDHNFSTLALPRPSRPATPHLKDPLLPLSGTPEPKRLGLHFHDPMSGLGLMGGIEFDRSAPTHSGRLLLFLGGTEMVLFTGEDNATSRPGRVRVGGLVWQGQEEGLKVSYQGTVMRFSHPQAFIRLEEGLAASWLEPADISLRLTFPQPISGPSLPLVLSHLQGEVQLRDRRCKVDAWGFLDMLRSEETGRLLPRRLLSLPFGSDLGIFLSWVDAPDGPLSSGVVYHHGTPHRLRPEDWDLHYTLERGRPTGFRLSLTPPTPLELHCSGETMATIPVVRHAPQGRALAVTFGLSRTVWQGREARGVYEFSDWRRD